MTLGELLLRERVAQIQRLHASRLELVERMDAADCGGIRRVVASALVRLGSCLDRGAVERALVVRRAR